MKTILMVVLIGIVSAGLLWACNEGLKRSEKVECLQWQQDSEDYPLWYSTGWQKEQCRTFGIELK